MRKDKTIFKIFYSSFLRSVFLFILTLCIFLGTAEAQTVAPIAGVDDNARKALTYQALAAVGFEMASADAIIEMPSSVAAVTCLTHATTAALDVSGNLFSGKISKESNDIVSNSLESHFKNFDISNIISYDTELDYSAAFKVDLKMGIGGAAGPTVKHLECPASATLWEAKEKRPPIILPSFAEAIKNLSKLEESEESKKQSKYKNSTGEVPSVGSKFIAAWSASSDGLEAAQQLKDESSTFKNRYLDMDVDFSKHKDPCEALKSMSKSSFNCKDFK